MGIQKFRNFSMVEGINVGVAPLLLKESEAELLRNVKLDILGKWSKRKGTLLYGSQNTSGNPCLGLHQFNTSAGTENQLCAFSNDSNTVIYKITDTTLNGAITTSTTTITLTDATNFASSGTIEIGGDLITYSGKSSNDLTGVTGITDSHANNSTVRQWKSSLATDTDNKKTRFANFLNRAIRVNEAGDAVKAYDGSTWETTGDPINPDNAPAGSLIETFQDRVFISGSSLPDRLYASSIASVTNTISWDTSTKIIDVVGSNAFYIDINPEDGQNLKAIKRNGALLLLFKERSLYTWNGSSTQSDELISVGTISQETVINVHNLTLFLGRSQKDLGIYAFTGGYPKLISRKIKKWTDNITQTSANFSNMCTGATSNEVFFYVGDVAFSNDSTYGTRTFSDTTLVYNMSQDSWTIYTGLSARIFGNLINSSSEKLYLGDSNGKVFEFGNGTTDDSGDSKTPIEMEIITKEEPYGAPELPMSLLGMSVYSQKAQGTSVKYSFNRSEDWRSLQNLRQRFTVLSPPGNGDNNGETLQFKFTNNTTQTCEVEGFIVEIDQHMETKRDNK